MTDTPTFLRRPRRTDGHATLDTGIRDIIANLNASADTDTAEILAGGVNLYSSAIIRFRGSSAFTARDVQQLFAIWQVLLDVRAIPEPDYSSARSSGPNSGPKADEDVGS